MTVMRRFCIWFVIMCLGFHYVEAQTDVDVLWSDVMERWAEQNDSEVVPDDLAEQFQELSDSPVNLNDTSLENLDRLLFLTDFQRGVLRAYIAQNGPLVSMNELYLLNGFDSVTLAVLRCTATVAPVDKGTENIVELIKKGRNKFIIGGRRTFPDNRGYQEEMYIGSPYRLYFRYDFKSSDRISIMFSGEKDPGEAFAFGRYAGVVQRGFDYYGYHLMLNDFGRLRRIVVGKYQLQFGQGATLWSGYAPWASGSLPLRRYGAGVRPASAFCEYGYLRGVAATVALLPVNKGNAIDLTLFYSGVDRDATEAAVDTANEWGISYQSLYQAGYHRTELELSKKEQLKETIYGGHLQYRNHNLVVGATSYSTLLSNALTPVDNVYNAFAFRGKRNYNGGIDAVYGYNRIQFFGEAAISYNDSSASLSREYGYFPLAAVAGMQMQFNADNLLSVAYRYGSPTYNNLHANVIGEGSSVGNEESVLVFFWTCLPLDVSLQTSLCFFRYPALRYRIYSPSSGVDYRLKMFKTVAPNVVLDCQYRFKTSQRNSTGQIYDLERVSRQQLQLSLDYTPSLSWRFRSRVVVSKFGCENHADERGFLLYQDVTYKTTIGKNPFSVGSRMSLFDVTGYDARIFSYESDLLYEYYVPMIMNRGMRFHAVIRYSCTTNLSLAVKYGISYYPELETMGSGWDKVEGNRRHDIKAQLKWCF